MFQLPKKKFTEKDVLKAVKLLKESDINLKLIAKRLGCSLATIRKINKENGFLRDPPYEDKGLTKERNERRKKLSKKINGNFLLL